MPQGQGPIPSSKEGPGWERVTSSSLLVIGSGSRPDPISAQRGSALVVIQGGAHGLRDPMRVNFGALLECWGAALWLPLDVLGRKV